MRRTYDLGKSRLEVRYFSWKELLVIFFILLLVMIIILSIIFLPFNNVEDSIEKEAQIDITEEIDVINDYYNKRKNIKFSKLGETLFMNSKFNKKDKIFKILIWKDGQFLERRHMKYYSQQIKDPFEDCSVDNCIITYEDSEIKNADAVVFLLKRLNGTESLPDLMENPRKKDQRWIFLTDDSPWNVFMNKDLNDWKSFSGKFNWSMNYKIESDVPVPYGRTLPIINDTKSVDVSNITTLIPFYESKQDEILLATMTNDCPNDRVRTLYMKEMMKYLKIDIYGECGEEFKNTCSKHFSADCKPLNNYFFYLAFENSNCEEYLTDNIYWNAFAKGAIPIIMGPTIENCEIALPPNSFLHVEKFNDMKELADYLLHMNRDDLLTFHEWRRNFMIVNEHGYHGTRSYHYCRICEALNYNNDEEKIYDDLSFYLDPEVSCRNVAKTKK